MLDLTKLAAVPHPDLPLTEAIQRGIEQSAAYLGSEAALSSIARDPYWPKWDSPWWHMLLLHELGETERIPAATAEALAARIDRLLHIFPIHPGEVTEPYDPKRDVACHCALGCMAPILAARGVDVGRALPWIKHWFVRYQMADGGLNCDENAYCVVGECPSSMVGTVAPLEAMLRLRAAPDDGDEERGFIDRAGRFLLDRGLVRGSATVHNAGERRSAPAWRQLCFPRLYYYDILRGLAALLDWAEETGESLPRSAIAEVAGDLVARFPDGVVPIERRADAGMTTVLPDQPGARALAASFPLLEAAGVVGQPSAALTRQWSDARRKLLRLADAGRLVD